MNKKIPAKCISVADAKKLQKTWCDTRTSGIDSRVGFQDAREFEWRVEELMEYLKYVKSESKKQGILDPGIRVYFGAYPKEKCKMNRGYSTVFFAPTGHAAKSMGKEALRMDAINYNIDPYNGGGSGRPPNAY